MMNDSSLKLENQLCFALYSASKAIIHAYKPLLEPLNLTYTQYITLLALWEHHPLSMKALGDLLNLDSGTLTPLLKRLEEKELLHRSRSSDDERQVDVDLTEKGLALKSQAVQIPQQLQHSLSLSLDDATALYQLLKQVIDPAEAEPSKKKE